LACALTQTEVQRADSLGALAPYGIVMAHMLLELFGNEIARELRRSARVAAETNHENFLFLQTNGTVLGRQDRSVAL
jgi:hypothetical protein